MTQNPQDGGDRSRVTGEGDVSAVIMSKDIVKETLESGILGRIGFAHIRRPKRIVFGEIGLDDIGGVGGVDVGFATTTVTCVDADCFTKKLDGGISESMDPGRGYLLTSLTSGMNG